MGVIPPATDLAPAYIWEECDLTIRLFQAHPCLSWPASPKNVLLLETADEGMQQEGKEEKLKLKGGKNHANINLVPHLFSSS